MYTEGYGSNTFINTLEIIILLKLIKIILSLLLLLLN